MVEEIELEKCNFRNFRNTVTLPLLSLLLAVLRDFFLRPLGTPLTPPVISSCPPSATPQSAVKKTCSLACGSFSIWNFKRLKVEAKDVLPKKNRTQAAKRAEKCCFCPWWPWPSKSKLVRATDQTCLLCEFAAKSVQQFQRYFIPHHTTPPPQPFYGPFSRTTRVSRCQMRTSGIYGARED